MSKLYELLLEQCEQMMRLKKIMKHFQITDDEVIAEVATFLFDGIGEDPLRTFYDTDQAFGRLRRANPLIKDIEVIDLMVEKDWENFKASLGKCEDDERV